MGRLEAQALLHPPDAHQPLEVREPYDYENGQEDEGKDENPRGLYDVPVFEFWHFQLLLSVPACSGRFLYIHLAYHHVMAHAAELVADYVELTRGGRRDRRDIIVAREYHEVYVDGLQREAVLDVRSEERRVGKE